MITKYVLMLSIYSCAGGGIDPGMIPGLCSSRSQPVEMPSLEVCDQVRRLNQGSACWARYEDEPAPATSSPFILSR